MATDTETNMVIVLESELLVDIFALTAKAQENVPVLRNLLILMSIMLREKSEQVIEQLGEFDVVSMLVPFTYVGTLSFTKPGLRLIAVET